MEEKYPALRKLLAPVDTKTFWAEYFEKKPLLIQRNTPDYFAGLLTLKTLSHYLDRKDLRTSALRLVKQGLELPTALYTHKLAIGSVNYDDFIDNGKTIKLYGEGVTIVCKAIQRAFPALAELCQDLENETHFQSLINTYLTPKASKGFQPHHDTHEVFILQLAGSKLWRIYDSPVKLPTKGSDKKPVVGKPEMEVLLKEGDTLYIPRGFIHDAVTTDEASLHATLALITKTWADVFDALKSKMHTIDAFRETFIGDEVTEDDFKQKLKQLSSLLTAEASSAEVKETFAKNLALRKAQNEAGKFEDLIE